MSQIRKLLYLTQPEQHHSPGLQRALALASACDATLHVMVYVEPLATYLLETRLRIEVRDRLVTQQREMWESECRVLRERGVKITSSVLAAEDLREEMLQNICELQPDLVIKDVQRESALMRSFITPLDWYLVRQSPTPVLMVNEVRHPSPRKIVAAVDPADPDTQVSGINDKIISVANGLALQCDAELHLLFVYDVMPVMTDAGGGGIAWISLAEEMRGELHESFKALADKFGVPEERRHFLVGTAVQSIASFTRKNAIDVVVMGRIHHKTLDKLVGSTTEHLLNQIDGSVLTVRP
ncbi:universal stress protein [Pseudomonas sp. QE6]|uniref:universal stress protein n=1 Tax=Pseudomonas sp. QE6 TaxID=3242491 RepID=UPI003529453A